MLYAAVTVETEDDTRALDVDTGGSAVIINCSCAETVQQYQRGGECTVTMGNRSVSNSNTRSCS